MNTVTLAMEDPRKQEQIMALQILELAFLGIYTLEMLLKIFAKGFILNKGAYLRESWNFLDFVIVVSGYFIEI